MPWNDTTKIMTGPLNINSNGDIQQATQMSSGDLGYCIVNGRINKWAKFKPVRSPKIMPLTEAELKAMNYGITITKYTNLTDLTAAISARSGWDYNQPLNNGSDRYRHFDFLNPNNASQTGYRGNANSFFAYSEVPTRVVKSAGGCVIRVNWQSSDTVDGSITTADLSDVNGDNISLANMYLGVLIYNPTSGGYFYKTTSSAIGSSVSTYISEVTFSDSEITTIGFGTCSVYLFLAATSATTLLTTTGNINNALSSGAYTLPDQGVETMVIASAGYYLNVTGLSAIYGTDDNNIPAGALEVKCNLVYAADVAVTVNDVTVEIYTSYNSFGTDVLLSTYTHTEASLLLPTTRTTWSNFINKQARVSYRDYITAVLTFRYGSETITQKYSRKVTDGSIPPPID